MTMLPTANHCVVLRLLLREGLLSSVASAGVSAGAFASGAFVLLFAIMTAASAAAFFCASWAARVLSATILPAATRFGFFASRVVGVGEVACCVVSAAGVSGCCCCCSVDIVPCDAPVIFMFKRKSPRGF